jgi:hypothetical protein
MSMLVVSFDRARARRLIIPYHSNPFRLSNDNVCTLMTFLIWPLMKVGLLPTISPMCQEILTTIAR